MSPVAFGFLVPLRLQISGHVKDVPAPAQLQFNEHYKTKDTAPAQKTQHIKIKIVLLDLLKISVTKCFQISKTLKARSILLYWKLCSLCEKCVFIVWNLLCYALWIMINLIHTFRKSLFLCLPGKVSLKTLLNRRVEIVSPWTSEIDNPRVLPRMCSLAEFKF